MLKPNPHRRLDAVNDATKPEHAETARDIASWYDQLKPDLTKLFNRRPPPDETSVLFVVDGKDIHDRRLREMPKIGPGLGALAEWLPPAAAADLIRRGPYEADAIEAMCGAIAERPERGNRWIILMRDGNLGLQGVVLGTTTRSGPLSPNVKDDGQGGLLLDAPAMLRWFYEMDLADIGKPDARAAIGRFQERVVAEMQTEIEQGATPNIEQVLAKVGDLPRLRKIMASSHGNNIDMDGVLALISGPSAA